MSGRRPAGPVVERSGAGGPGREDGDARLNWPEAGTATHIVRAPVPKHPVSLAVLSLWAIACSAGACVGMALIAGFPAMARRVATYDWRWSLVSAAAVLVAFAGYRLAFDRVVWSDGHRVSRSERFGVVMAGFGAFVPKGGTALDRYVMRITGRGRRETDVRLVALQIFEVIPIALAACLAACVALFSGRHLGAPLGYALPWAIGPAVGAPLVALALHRYRARQRRGLGWPYWVGVALDGIAMVGFMARSPRRWSAFVAMAVFSAGELLAVWSALAAFGYRMSAVHLVLGYGVGYVISRRSAPLGGAGIIDILLILALANIGVPLTAAVAGTFTYRCFNLWCPLPASMAAIRRIRALALREGKDPSEVMLGS